MRLFLVILAVCCIGLRAEDIYVAENAAGANDGTSCANARSRDWLNTAANWGGGAGEIDPGDTVHFCGTLTNAITIPISGTAGNPIIFVWETGAKFSAPDLVSTNRTWINVNGKNYLTFDGQGTGVIETTNVGTPGTAENYVASDNFGIQDNVAGGDNITIKNLMVGPLYRRIITGLPSDANKMGWGISLGGSNIIISNVVAHGAYGPIGFTWGGSMSNLSILNCTVTNAAHNITLGCAQSFSARMNGITIHGNKIDGIDWDGNLGIHLNGIIIINESTAPDNFVYPNDASWMSNVVVSANVFGPRVGSTNTAALFIDQYYPYQGANVKIINNVFSQTNGVTWNNGALGLGGCDTNTLVANNTFVGPGKAIGVGNGMGVKMYNNIFYGITAPLGENNAYVTESDYNIWYGTTTNTTGGVAVQLYRVPTVNKTGSWLYGDTMTGGTSGASMIFTLYRTDISPAQVSGRYMFVGAAAPFNNRFLDGEIVTSSSGGTLTISGGTTKGVQTVAVAAGGTDYRVNDVLVLTGGTYTTIATLKVTAISGSAVSAVVPVALGSYSVVPPNSISTTNFNQPPGAIGTNALFDVVWSNQIDVPNAGFRWGNHSTFDPNDPILLPGAKDPWWLNLNSPGLPKYDNNSTIAQPSLNSDYSPQTNDVVAIGQGTNLFALFTTDILGNARPSSGPWTIGAYEGGTNQSVASAAFAGQRRPIRFLR